MRRAFEISSILVVSFAARGADFVGAQACAVCHVAIGKTQSKSAMALTWRGEKTDLLPASLPIKQPGSGFQLERNGGRLQMSLASGDGAKAIYPVEVVMGGQRHGLSFLAGIDQLDGIPLARAALVEARFAWSTPRRQLALSPGFPEEPPATLETALGRVLSPAVEKKCVTCHGAPDTLETGVTGGVHCESCHGAGSEHLLSVGRGNPRGGIINPARLDADARMAVCAPCHTGFTRQSDPLPDDLLVSNQVNALTNSECFIQSGKALGCTSCHDPHGDSAGVQAATIKTCVGCHSPTRAGHAATCPVNATRECVSCHMPSIQKGSFHMVDHWIRVHPEQHVEVKQAGAQKSQVQPLREFVRIISAPGREDIESAVARLGQGDGFFQVAREKSKDPSAPIGGYLGAVWLAQFDPKLAQTAAGLAFGQVSLPVEMDNHWVVIQRLPRDFKYQAEQLFEHAGALRAKGDTKAALAKYQQALIVYPNFLRALVGMGTAFAENGDVTSGAGVLSYAVQVYPEDADAQFNLGIALGGLGRHQEELAAYRRAIEIDPERDSVYENLGAACAGSGVTQGAIEAFQKGLQVNPLSSVLYYDLSLVLAQTGDKDGSIRALALATKIDPRIGRR